MLQPIFRICGSKTGQSLQDAAFILRRLLSHDTRLVEPFCGSASVSIATKHHKLLLADLQPHAVLALQVLRSRPIALLDAFDDIRKPYLIDPTKEDFYEIRNNPPREPILRAAWYIFIVHACFNWLWRVNRQGKCNTTHGGKAGAARTKRAMQEQNVLALASYLDSNQIEITLQDCFATIEQTGQNDLLYIDPPYIGLFDSYCSEVFGWAGHLRLGTALRESWVRGSKIVIHCNADQRIAELYIDYCRIFLRGVFRKVGAGKGADCRAWEMILISQDAELFPECRAEELLQRMGMIEAIYQEGEWVKWIPTQSSNLSLF